MITPFSCHHALNRVFYVAQECTVSRINMPRQVGLAKTVVNSSQYYRHVQVLCACRAAFSLPEDEQ